MRKFLTASLVIMLLLVTGVPVSAAQENTLTIYNSVDFGSGDQLPSPFTAWGPAVDAGLFCASGTVYTIETVVAGPPDFSKKNFQTTKVFECDDGSGSITVFLHAHVVFDPYHNIGEWNVLSGTGDYGRLYGRGSQVGEPTVVGVNDTYTGWVNY
jgi:hypothetical protein